MSEELLKVLREYFSVDESSKSCLRWSNPNYKRFGYEAGTVDRDGYWIVRLFGKGYKAHRVVYGLVNGPFDPELQIDHINRQRWDNRVENLRVVPSCVNSRNLRKLTKNTSGTTGVTFQQRHYWRADWREAGKTACKLFSTIEYGDEEAYRMACEYRANKILELNLKGYEYAEEHGM